VVLVLHNTQKFKLHSKFKVCKWEILFGLNVFPPSCNQIVALRAHSLATHVTAICRTKRLCGADVGHTPRPKNAAVLACNSVGHIDKIENYMLVGALLACVPFPHMFCAV